MRNFFSWVFAAPLVVSMVLGRATYYVLGVVILVAAAGVGLGALLF